MIYFKSRAEAGQMLAERLAGRSNDSTVIMALDEGSALVGAQIALSLGAKLLLYKVRNIYLPNEADPTAAMDMTGKMRYNDLLSIGQIEEIISEFRNYMDEQRMQKFHEMNLLLGNDGVIDKNDLRHHNVIVVADGLPSSFAISMVAEFLKTIAIETLTAAVPIASRDAADQIHRLTDEQHILGVIENYVSTDHYYDDNHIPDTEETIHMMSRMGFGWQKV